MSATVQQPKLCPILSVRSATDSTGKSILTACQGDRCMFFLPVRDEKAEVIGGSCAITVLACEINQINAREEVKIAVERDRWTGHVKDLINALNTGSVSK